MFTKEVIKINFEGAVTHSFIHKFNVNKQTQRKQTEVPTKFLVHVRRVVQVELEGTVR